MENKERFKIDSSFAEYVAEHYGDLEFYTNFIVISTQEPIEVKIGEKVQRYFLPESIIQVPSGQEKIDLHFSFGGFGRAVALAKNTYLSFHHINEKNEVAMQARTKIPEVDKSAIEGAKKELNHPGAMFSINATINDFEVPSSGMLIMSLDFEFEDDKMVDIIKQSGAPTPVLDDTRANFSQELARVKINLLS